MRCMLLTLWCATSVIALSAPSYKKSLPTDARSSDALAQVETSVARVLTAFPDYSGSDSDGSMAEVPKESRESLGVANRLDQRLQGFRRNNDCPRCWFQRAHCICSQCPPAELDHKHQSLNRIFVVMHHKEIALKVDTAKLILMSFPEQARLVVAGIGPEYQESMKELQDAMNTRPDRCLVLFPDESAKTFEELVGRSKVDADSGDVNRSGWDLIVLDGTWAQARKMYARYIPSDPIRIRLSDEAVQALDNPFQGSHSISSGHQLRRHTIKWRQIGTFEATRLFLQDFWKFVDSHDESNASTLRQPHLPAHEQIRHYQDISNAAAMKELGPPRVSAKREKVG